MRRLSSKSWTALVFLLGAMLLNGVPVASAQEPIGIAITVLNDVTGILIAETAPITQEEKNFRNEAVKTGRESSAKLVSAKLLFAQNAQSSPINPGGKIFRDEAVKTGQESLAKIVFADNTNLDIGPESTVTMDKFVYAGEADYQKATVELVKGAFRFITGDSHKRAYEINTPVATLGVRGTVVDILSETARTTVVLQEGKVLACARALPPSAANRCAYLTHPGDTAIITETSAKKAGIDGIGWSFAGLCAAEASLCEKTILALMQHVGQNDHGLSPHDMSFFRKKCPPK